MDKFEHWEDDIRKQMKTYFCELYDLRPSESEQCVQVALMAVVDLVAKIKQEREV